MSEQVSAFSIADALLKTYAAPRYATALEVRNATGFAANRACDVLSLSLWPSDGMHLMGFEIKVSRGDWANELKNPKKANDIARYCDFWSLACPPDVCPLDDPRLPEAWGLYHWNGKKLVKAKQPAQREPEPLDRKFLAAILRANLAAMNRMVLVDTIAARLVEAREAGAAGAKSQAECETRRLREDHARLQRQVAEFEREAGLRFADWGDCRPSTIGKAAKWLNDGGVEGQREKLLRFAEQAEQVADVVRELLAMPLSEVGNTEPVR